MVGILLILLINGFSMEINKSLHKWLVYQIVKIPTTTRNQMVRGTLVMMMSNMYVGTLVIAAHFLAVFRSALRCESGQQ